MGLVCLYNFIPLPFWIYISGLFKAESTIPKKYSYPYSEGLKYIWIYIIYRYFKSYNDFKKIIDRNNENAKWKFPKFGFGKKNKNMVNLREN